MSWLRKAIRSVTQSEFRQKADRIAEIYGAGSAQDGIHTLFGLKISEDDYMLMGCANSCGKRNFPDVSNDDRSEGRWFTGGHDLDGSRFYNCHLTQRSNGTWAVDSFYSSVPRPEYRPSPEEVAWHYCRVKELRAGKIPQEERARTISTEAKNKPWLEMQ